MEVFLKERRGADWPPEISHSLWSTRSPHDKVDSAYFHEYLYVLIYCLLIIHWRFSCSSSTTSISSNSFSIAFTTWEWHLLGKVINLRENNFILPTLHLHDPKQFDFFPLTELFYFPIAKDYLFYLVFK